MAKQTESPGQRTVTITAPKMARARFRIVGTSPLVVYRFELITPAREWAAASGLPRYDKSVLP